MLYFTVLPSERPLHYEERVLPIIHSFGTDSRLLIKKHVAMDAMILYLGIHTNQIARKFFFLNICIVSPSCGFILSNLSFSLSASKVDVSKHGLMKFREEKSILTLFSGSFHERYFILNSTSFRMYKDVRVRSTDLQLILVLVVFFHRLIHCVSVSLSVCQSNRPEREWPAKNLKVYLGIKKKLNPPTW